MNFRERKALRKKLYDAKHGVKLSICLACNGTGYYDHNGSPPCDNCDGVGKIFKFKKS